MVVFEGVSFLSLRDSDTTDALDLFTIKLCSADFVCGVSGVARTPVPVVGAKGCGVPRAPSLRRFCRAFIKANIVESACAAYSLGPCLRESQRSRSQTPLVLLPRCFVGVNKIRGRQTSCEFG